MKNTQQNEEDVKVAPAQEAATATLDGSELGEIKIHENVAAALVRKAVLGVEGVSRLSGNALVDNIAEFVGSRRMQSRAIAIDMAENGRIAIEVKVNLIFGSNIPETAQKIQKAVIEAVESVTGMTVTGVNVIVQEIEEPLPPEEESAADGNDAAPVGMPLN